MKSRSLFHAALVALVLFAASSSSVAQTPADSNFRRFSVGPYVTVGAGVFAGAVPNSWKTDLKFNWTMGAMSQFATSPKFAVILGLGYDNRNLFFKEDTNAGVTTAYKFSTLDVITGVKFNDFMLSIAFGFPMSARADLTSPSGKSLEAPESYFSTDSLATKIELRLGAAFNLVESEVGKLQFIIVAGYSLTNAFESKKFAMLRLNEPGASASDIDRQITNTPGTNESRSIESSQHGSLQLGFSYLFNLGGKY